MVQSSTRETHLQYFPYARLPPEGRPSSKGLPCGRVAPCALCSACFASGRCQGWCAPFSVFPKGDGLNSCTCSSSGSKDQAPWEPFLFQDSGPQNGAADVPVQPLGKTTRSVEMQCSHCPFDPLVWFEMDGADVSKMSPRIVPGPVLGSMFRGRCVQTIHNSKQILDINHVDRGACPCYR